MDAIGLSRSTSGDRLPSSIVVVIQEDPQKSGRAVEALRIALGLGAGENPMTVVLLNQAPLLLSEDTDDIADVDILEKHLPVFKELNIPFLLEQDSRSRFSLDTDFTMREASESDIANTIATADRVLVF
jgi:sulfur relay (sulfurtransferase) DsrF/TusC family protein